jgi:hypothetical protein
MYAARGQRVGLVTNDQADDLVDTNSLRGQGFPVEEVAGACFCCRFDDLVERVTKLQAHDRPDVILAEPVGSCTDLVATVVQPLKDLYKDRFQVAPYPVLFKPSHGLRILRNEGGAGFSAKAAYIFHKQLEEADAIILNRIDELSPEAVGELSDLVAARYPGTPILRMSALTGEGLEPLVALLDQEGAFGKKILDIDYDTYAEGEAEMGWLNSAVQVEARSPFALDDLVLGIVSRLQAGLATRKSEVAHLKIIGLCEGAFAVANLVSSSTTPELSLSSRTRTEAAEVIVNARVAIDPGLLEQEMRQAVETASAAAGAQAKFGKINSLRPGRPTPTHRYATVKSV